MPLFRGYPGLSSRVDGLILIFPREVGAVFAKVSVSQLIKLRRDGALVIMIKDMEGKSLPSGS